MKEVFNVCKVCGVKISTSNISLPVQYAYTEGKTKGRATLEDLNYKVCQHVHEERPCLLK